MIIQLSFYFLKPVFSPWRTFWFYLGFSLYSAFSVRLLCSQHIYSILFFIHSLIHFYWYRICLFLEAGRGVMISSQPPKKREKEGASGIIKHHSGDLLDKLKVSNFYSWQHLHIKSLTYFTIVLHYQLPHHRHIMKRKWELKIKSYHMQNLSISMN